MARHIGPVPQEWTPLSYADSWPEKTNLAQTILTRRSRRNFVTTPLSRDLLPPLLESLALSGTAYGGGQPSDHETLAIGCLVGARALNPVLPPGPPATKMGIGAAEGGSPTMARICLDQAWLTQAALHFLFIPPYGKWRSAGDPGDIGLPRRPPGGWASGYT